MCDQLDHITYIGGVQIFEGGGAENDLDNLDKIQPDNFWILGSLRTPPLPKKINLYAKIQQKYTIT